jgi:hypothetical protein
MDREDEIDFRDDDLPENALWCDRCQGLGMAECYCGGDQCYCDNNGEMECPQCDGEGFYVPTARQIQRDAGMHAALSAALAQADTRRMAETPLGGSGRSPSGTVAEGDAPLPLPLRRPHHDR